MVTIYKDVYSKEPHYISVEEAFRRIKTGKNKDKVAHLRTIKDKDEAQRFKATFPSILFNGKFGKERTDADLIESSGFIILDFDHCGAETKWEIAKNEYVHAAWVSPSGDGVKALVKLSNPKLLPQHFSALQEVFTNPKLDNSGQNQSRVCYESHDPEIYINENSKIFSKIKKTEKVTERLENKDGIDIFFKLQKWLDGNGNAFVTGERNLYIFKLASACCRFGLSDLDTCFMVETSILSNDNSFSVSECHQTIKSAYKANYSDFGSAVFDNEKLVDKVTRTEFVINQDIYDLEIAPKDVIYGGDVKEEALSIFHNGYESANSTYAGELDTFFKWKRGEITLLSGIGNYGKSTILKYLLLLQVIKDGKKFAFFSPEDNPPYEFYHDFVEMYLGESCTPDNPNRPNERKYNEIYDLISKHIFYIYPKDLASTPEYIKERFLEMVIKEKVDGCIIDPFNQLTNNYSKAGGRDDRYLETVLSDFSRFAQLNSIYFVIVAHPVKMVKSPDGNYPCPDVFDLAGGAMWNNKMDNILIYHRPVRGTAPLDVTCEIHSKKIRRQKIVGVVGTLNFELSRRKRRFFINGRDYMEEVLSGVTPQQIELKPNIDFYHDPTEPRKDVESFTPLLEEPPF